MERTALYRATDGYGRLLYVGISNCGFRRLSQHLAKSEWRYSLAAVSIQWFDSRQKAERAEMAAIQSEKPVFNVCYNRSSKIAPPPPTPEELDEHEDDELEAMLIEDMQSGRFRETVRRITEKGY
jgi:hypothetical protein